MKQFSNLTFKQKLLWIILASSAAALVLGVMGFITADLLQFRRAMPRDLQILAKIIADNGRAPLGFHDPKFARDTLLASLAAHPRITRAALYDAEGEVFADYARASHRDIPLPATKPHGHAFANGHLSLFEPIREGTEVMGTVYLQSDLGDLHARLRAYGLVTLGVMVMALGGAFIMGLWLQRFLAQPVEALAQTARGVVTRNDYSLRANKYADDELGALTDTFNQMLSHIQDQDQALKESRERFVDASRLAGMAEVATGVLHNVGNVLNSVNVSATLVQERLRESKLASFVKTAAVLQEHSADLGAFLTNDPRGQRIPPFLIKLAGHLAAEQEGFLKELAALTKNIEHIKEIVAMQQSYARVAGVLEPLAPVQLMEDALQLNEAALARHRIRLVREFAEVPPVLVDKHKVLQILINLIRNAKYALDQGKPEEKRLTLGIDLAGPERVQIFVRDNGVGIAPENLTRIFGHGFTTKKEGHGFGLHSGANAAKELGGSLRAHSDGLGITVCYWRSVAGIAAWKAQAEHAAAQREGRARWYESYNVRVARVERAYGFDAGAS